MAKPYGEGLKQMGRQWLCLIDGSLPGLYPGPVTFASVACLYVLTALAEIVGCYSVYAAIRLNQSLWFLVLGALSLALFAWLLSLHPGPAGRVYAAYGAVYIAVSLLWLWGFERQIPDRWDVVGVIICLFGAGLIYFGPRS